MLLLSSNYAGGTWFPIRPCVGETYLYSVDYNQSVLASVWDLGVRGETIRVLLTGGLPGQGI